MGSDAGGLEHDNQVGPTAQGLDERREEKSVPVGPYVHPLGLCESERVGGGTHIWAFAHVLPGATIGRDCNICDHVFIENDVIVGDRVTIKSGVQLWDGVRLANDVFVGPNATFTNDPFPRSKNRPDRFVVTEVGEGASLGGGSTILPGLRIGRKAMVGAGAVVTRNVPPNAIVVGNPARIIGYVGALEPSVGARDLDGNTDKCDTSGVGLQDLTQAVDLRGSLIAADFATDLPFEPRRVFAVFGVPTTEVRGEHAHRVCQQFLVCLRGRVACLVDDGSARRQYVLDRPNAALHVPAMNWGSQYKYSSDALLLVLASHEYDADDYIRDYDDFLAERKKMAAAGPGAG